MSEFLITVMSAALSGFFSAWMVFCVFASFARDTDSDTRAICFSSWLTVFMLFIVLLFCWANLEQKGWTLDINPPQQQEDQPNER